KFLASYQPPRAKTVPLAETSTIQANPSAAALTPARPAAEPVRNQANSRFKTTMMAIAFQLIAFLFLENRNPTPKKTINPSTLIAKYMDLTPFLKIHGINAICKFTNAK